jgi:hypothetical protein
MFDRDEVLASARAMSATHPNAPLLVASTPWSETGSFHAAITAGDADGRIVAGPAPSWVANPGAISEESARKKERNPRIFAREYQSCFVAGFEGDYFPNESVKQCTDKGRSPTPAAPPIYTTANYVVSVDPAFYADEFGLAIAHSEASEFGAVGLDWSKLRVESRSVRASPLVWSRQLGTLGAGHERS